MKFKYAFFFFATFCISITFAQSTHFRSNTNWTMNKKELVLNIGASQFLGDLGGQNGIGRQKSLRDLDIASTNINAGVGYRYRFAKHFATTSMFEFSMLRGNDALTEEPARHARNLHFRSPFLNITQKLEWIIYANDEVGSRLGMKGGVKNKNFRVYVFGGVGVAYFNPQAKYNGSWVNLRPLRTEGQGLENGPKEYSNFTVTIPAGIGVRIGISKMWAMGIEASYLKTFSDYIDDVHGVYYDPAILAQSVGAASAYLSNPSTNPSWFTPGSIRGKKDKDAVFYLNFTFTRNFTYKNYKMKFSNIKYRYQRSKF